MFNFKIHIPFNQDFFVPKPSFIRWFVKTYFGKNIIEAGAGRGLFSSKLTQKMAISAYDIATRDGQLKHVIPYVDCSTLPFTSDSVVVVARPNHNGFTHNLFANCVKQNVEEILYIGLEKNFDDDIDSELYQYTIIKKDVGEDNEMLLKITKK